LRAGWKATGGGVVTRGEDRDGAACGWGWAAAVGARQENVAGVVGRQLRV
jgi:hypothetical protein